MKVYGSITNRLMESPQALAPTEGMGATILMFSDRHAATVIEVRSPKRIVIQEDEATRTDKNGMSENQEYTFKRNPHANKHLVTKRKDGSWKIAKSQTGVLLGSRDEHYDFGF